MPKKSLPVINVNLPYPGKDAPYIEMDQVTAFVFGKKPLGKGSILRLENDGVIFPKDTGPLASGLNNRQWSEIWFKVAEVLDSRSKRNRVFVLAECSPPTH